MQENNGRNSYQVQAVDRAIDILQAFSARQPFLSLAEIAAATSLSKATAYRILSTLQNRGLIGKRADNVYYCLGSEISALAGVRARHSGLIDVCMPEMRRIRDVVDETVSLGARVGNERVQLYQLEGFRLPKRGSMSGERSPLYAGASNKLLLSAMSDSELRSFFGTVPLLAFTESTIVDQSLLWEAIDQIRKAGFSESVSEKFVGGASLATPIYNAEGDLVAALSVSVPVERFSASHRERCLDELQQGAKSISSELGYRAARPIEP
ncbi:DNA-binding IclR family transcriptional regulator [Aminobacter niigataensis]|uniref:DNA-binding IclR family transcriptional regulator n=1 Tax=Aminobacter niigataensis TaxID=83265 RepID=A0ABR6L1I5_9HYPH|nr:IclR family transcriptional regulator [Aminobacter niigataensis]MBB4650622.1 DNA-binding IclR family transcriptional regulator [Aminobacter niigataensis]